MNYVTVNIRKPIYDNNVGIREKYIWQAKRQRKNLRIITPKGTTIISPDKFLEGAQRMEKVFLRPDEPMVLYYKNITPTKMVEEKPRLQKSTQDYSMPVSIFEELKRRNPDLVSMIQSK